MIKINSEFTTIKTKLFIAFQNKQNQLLILFLCYLSIFIIMFGIQVSFIKNIPIISSLPEFIKVKYTAVFAQLLAVVLSCIKGFMLIRYKEYF